MLELHLANPTDVDLNFRISKYVHPTPRVVEQVSELRKRSDLVGHRFQNIWESWQESGVARFSDSAGGCARIYEELGAAPAVSK